MKLLAFLLWAPLALAVDAPKLEFDQTTFDFGHAVEADEIDGKFTFRNAGSAELKIGTLETSCGCTDAKVKPDTLQPGEAGQITFKLDLTNARGPTRKTITVPSNDPDEPSRTLAISGEVKPLFDLSASLVMFGEIPPGEIARHTIEVRRLDGKKLSISQAEATLESLKISVQSDTNKPTEARLIIEAKGTGKPEQFSDILTVGLTGSTKPAFHIPIAGEFVASIKVSPGILVWNLPDADTTRKFQISATLTNQPLHVENFVTGFVDVLFKVTEIKTGEVYEVTMKLPDPPASSTNDWLTFDTNFPDRPTVAVPIRISVTESPLPK